MPDVNNIDFQAVPFYEVPLSELPVGQIDFHAVPFFEVPTPDIPTSNIELIGGVPTPPTPTAPTISNVQPAAATAIASTDPVSFDITDPEGFVRILLVADFPLLGIREVIHDGTSFSPNYTGFGNARTAITNGFSYSVLRKGGWPVSPIIIPYAIDTTGQENS